MKIELLKSKKKDLPLISKIYRVEMSKPPYNESWTQKKSMNKLKFFNKFYDLYSIKFDGKIVGFVCINPTFMCPGEVAFGEEIVISKAFQNKGIGKNVINQLFEIYKKRGFKRFMGIVDVDATAMNLYEKLNFNPSKKDVLLERKLN